MVFGQLTPVVTAPRRLQLSRRKGWRMPENTVKVDRSTKWGNPFIVGENGTRSQCVDLCASLLGGRIAHAKKPGAARQKQYAAYVSEHIGELHGKNLACWCPLDGPCHADILLNLASR